MAGIQFELKKAFHRKGLFARLGAYGYAAAICAGPTILGFAFLMGIRVIGNLAGASEQSMRELNAMITVTLLASLVSSNVLSMVTTRYTADQIYMKKEEYIMPSFIGGISVLLAVFCPLFAIFLHVSGLDPLRRLCCFLLFGELIIVWTEINYLTAIKDYQSIMAAYALSILISFGIAYLTSILWHMLPIDVILLIAVACAYGVMAVWYYVLLLQYFPRGDCSSLSFLVWSDRYPELLLIGILTSVGLYGPLIIMWYSPAGSAVIGLFRECPEYDIPSLISFWSTLPTTVNFVTSVEVNFYPVYRSFFGLLNEEGSLANIKIAEEEMTDVLKRELFYTFSRQCFSALLFIIGGTFLLPSLPLGFSDEMMGIYRILCCAYSAYSMGNVLMLMQLYFADNKGALISTAAFAAASFFGTLLSSSGSSRMYGFGFLSGGIFYMITALLLLRSYLANVMENVLRKSVIGDRGVRRLPTRIAEHFERRYATRYPKRAEEEIEEEDA